MSDALFDTHAHLISDDWHRYPPRALRDELPVPRPRDYTVPVGMLDTQDPATPARYAATVKQHGVRGFRMANTRPCQLDTAWMSSATALAVWRCCADLGTPYGATLVEMNWARTFGIDTTTRILEETPMCTSSSPK